jgi:predicted nucleic acid-binding Zn ribbon protein
MVQSTEETTPMRLLTEHGEISCEECANEMKQSFRHHM